VGISISCWNGNGYFWSSLSLMYDSLISLDILFATKTHVIPIWPLSTLYLIIGFQLGDVRRGALMVLEVQVK